MKKINEMYDAFQITDADKKLFHQHSSAFSDNDNDTKAYTIKTVIIGDLSEAKDLEKAPDA